jgi:hypothetical protein
VSGAPDAVLQSRRDLADRSTTSSASQPRPWSTDGSAVVVAELTDLRNMLDASIRALSG